MSTHQTHEIRYAKAGCY